MRSLIATLFTAALAVALTPPFLLPVADGAWIIRKVSVAASYLVEEDFEETGSPTGATWTDVNSPDYDSTSHTALSGEALELDASDQAYVTFTGQTTVWAAGKIEVNDTAIPASATSYSAIRDSSGVACALLRIGASGVVNLYADGADGTASSTFAISGDTLYYFWLKFVSGGTCELYVSTTPSKPSLGTDTSTQFATSKTGASLTAVRFDFRGATFTNAVFYDEVFVSTSELSNPWGD